MSTALEEATLQIHQKTALEEVQKQFPKYFEAINQHPRMLVGAEVPLPGRDGMETLKSSEDAKDWQEAVKSLLAAEVRDRAGRLVEGDKDMLQTLHASIELFQNNSDLVPGTKQFDKELADQLVKVAKPYELRVEGKLHGYTIPLQPLIEQLRTQLQESRKAAPAAPAAAPTAGAPAAAAAPAAPAAAPATGAPAPAPGAAAPAPQAGLTSKPGTSTEGEDFDELFATIGLRGLRI